MSEASRVLNPVFQRRREVLRNSKMHADAVAICLSARNLRTAVEDFVDEYSEDTGFNLFVANKCLLPTDTSHEGWDPNRSWSGWLYDDVSGFKWALSQFLSAIDGHLDAPDSDEDQATVEDVSPTVVVG